MMASLWKFLLLMLMVQLEGWLLLARELVQGESEGLVLAEGGVRVVVARCFK